MKVIAFDLEADNLPLEVTRVHCISLSINGDEPQLYINRRDVDTITAPYHGFIEDALEIMATADLLVGHNIIGYDLYVLEKLYGFHWDPLKTFDTLLASRIIYGDTLQKHSLEAWGERLRVRKGDFGKQVNAWEVMTDAMGLYCNQDVVVTVKVYIHMTKKQSRTVVDPETKKPVTKEFPSRAEVHLPPVVWDTERKVALIIRNQIIKGVLLDEERALELYAEIQKEYNTYSEAMRSIFPSLVKLKGSYTSSRFVPKRDNHKLGYRAGVECYKIEVVEFNPNSRAHIASSLTAKYGWVPKKLTNTGLPQVDEAVLSSLPYPEAAKLARLMLLAKRLGQLYTGKSGWLKVVRSDTGRIHGGVNTNGAVTGRMTHSGPNMAQVPRTKYGADGVLWGSKGDFGADCRNLFVAPAGRVLVGCDASGLELRMLAHYMARFDGGAYVKVVTEGDVHSVNQEAAGLPTRDDAKTFIYAFLYGAGDLKIGSIIGGSAYKGKALKAKFLRSLPALDGLIKGVTKKAKTQKAIRGLDGRLIRVRHQHAALNTLLQGAGAALMKRALVILWETADAGRYDFVLNVHDEFQAEVDEGYAKEFAKLAENSIRQAGKDLNLRCPMDAEAKIGHSWQETH